MTKLRGRTVENFPEPSLLVRSGDQGSNPGSLALQSFTSTRVAVLLLGNGCCGKTKHLPRDGGRGHRRGPEQVWNPGLKAPAHHLPHVSGRDANRIYPVDGLKVSVR